jgi:hypothetical protein
MSRKPGPNGQLYRWGVEFKTIKEEDFDKLTAPKPDHVTQASIYARLAGVWWISIVYYNKNRSFMKEYPVSYSEEVWQAVTERVAFLKGHINRKTLPVYDKKECQSNRGFCRHVSHCFGIEGFSQEATGFRR